MTDMKVRGSTRRAGPDMARFTATRFKHEVYADEVGGYI